VTSHSGSVTCVAWNNDGSKLATSSNGKSVKIWSVGSAGTCDCQSILMGDKEMKHVFFLSCVAFSPDGKILAICNGSMYGAGSVWLYGTVTGIVLATLRGHKDPVRSVCFSPCGTKIVSGGGLVKECGGNEDFSILIWDVKTGIQIGAPLTGHSNR
jgi:hypothetical protein